METPLNPLAWLEQYDQGRAATRQNKLARLADDTRQAQGAALRGDPNARNALAQLDPDKFVQTSNYIDSKKKAETAEFVGAIYAADTPEKFNSVVQRFKANGHQFDAGEDAWENRDTLLRQGMTVAEQMGIDLQKARNDAASALAQSNETYRRDVFGETIRHHKALEGTAAARVSAAKAAADAKNAPKPLSASMLKIKRETENNLVDISNTVAALKEAKGFLKEGVHSGNWSFPETRAAIGNTLPDWMVDDRIASPKSSLATVNFNKIMKSEAIQTMATTLKGATTDTELRVFVDLIADPSVPNSVKEKAIDRILRKAETFQALEQDRLKEFGDTMPAGSEAEQAGDDAYDETLRAAQEAIDNGADPTEVYERLREMPGYEDIELQAPEGEAPADGGDVGDQSALDPAQLQQMAEAAIAAGADPQAVKARVRQMLQPQAA